VRCDKGLPIGTESTDRDTYCKKRALNALSMHSQCTLNSISPANTTPVNVFWNQRHSNASAVLLHSASVRNSRHPIMWCYVWQRESGYEKKRCGTRSGTERYEMRNGYAMLRDEGWKDGDYLLSSAWEWQGTECHNTANMANKKAMDFILLADSSHSDCRKKWRMATLCCTQRGWKQRESRRQKTIQTGVGP